MAAYTELTPVFLLTGFLGSGKTTLLNRLLKHPSMGDAAVLINEVGEVAIDHYVVETVDESTVVLESGCICCTIRDDLKTSIMRLHDRRARKEIRPYRRLLIEATGLADPAPVLFTLISDPLLRHHYRAAAVIATVDAVNGPAQLDRHEEAVKQVSIADRIVLTKIDLAAPESTTELRARLENLNPSAQISTALFGNTDVEDLLRADLYARAPDVVDVLRDAGGAPADERSRPGDRHEAIRSFSLVYDREIDWTTFGIWLTMLLHAHGQNVLRVKGILNVKGVAQPVLINGVNHVLHPPIHLERWGDGDRRSRIVFIVRGLEPERIRASLQAFNQLAEG